MTGLREEFEPLLISDYGCHRTADLCAAVWDQLRKFDEAKQRKIEINHENEIAVCTAWLNRVTRTQRPVWQAHSYGLKHVVENWACYYVSNGSFIMAATRLGFMVQPLPGRHCVTGGGFVSDCNNALLNISKKVQPSQAEADVALAELGLKRQWRAAA
jgi:hypothetical protein